MKITKKKSPDARSHGIRHYFSSLPVGTSSTTTPPPPPAATASPSKARLVSSEPSIARSLPTYTSSLSSPPSSITPPTPTLKESPHPTPPARQVIEASDEESSDSDLADLATIFPTTKRAVIPSVPNMAPLTPAAIRFKQPEVFVSPLAALPKSRFDMTAILKESRSNAAAEASSKRIKAMESSKDEKENVPLFVSDVDIDAAKHARGSLLESVVAQDDERGLEKVSRALMRTEATNVEKCWNFFDTRSERLGTGRQPFPTASVPARWNNELSKPETRRHTFESGFAEDMITYGRLLPDELFLWILDEACFEQGDILRTSYFNAIRESTEQTSRLLTPSIIEKLFRNLGATSNATATKEKIIPKPGLPAPDLHHDWASLRSLVRFFQQSADSLQQESRQHVICLLLRMMVDNMVFRNIDLLDLLQDTVRRLCKYTPDDEWESCCIVVCRSMFESVNTAYLRLQILEAISSISPLTHDLRRRLALCFFFSDISYSSGSSYTSISLPLIMDRLSSRDFDTDSKSSPNYQELAALVALLDIAVDDGRSPNLDLTNPEAAEKFDEDVEELVAEVKGIMRGIGNPGAAFISRIEAKEALELVSQRFSDTLRTRPKAKLTHFDKPLGMKVENLDREKVGMSAFLAKVKAKRA